MQIHADFVAATQSTRSLSVGATQGVSCKARPLSGAAALNLRVGPLLVEQIASERSRFDA